MARQARIRVRTRMRTPTKKTSKQANKHKAHARTHARTHACKRAHARMHACKRAHTHQWFVNMTKKRATTHITTHKLLLLTLLHIHTPHTPQVRDQWVVHMTRREGGGRGPVASRGGWGGEGGGIVPPASPRQSLAHSLLSQTTSPSPRTPLGVVGPNLEAKET